MDFPLYLEQKEFVKGRDELHQVMYTVLKQPFGTILQDYKKGSGISIHIDGDLVVEMIRYSLEMISGVIIKSVKRVSEEEFDVIYSYQSEIDKFVFNFNS